MKSRRCIRPFVALALFLGLMATFLVPSTAAAQQFSIKPLAEKKLGQLPDATVKSMKAIGSIRLLRRRAETGNFGRVPGVAVSRRVGRVSRWLDRRAGVPAAGAVPPLVTWLADRLDDLAGMPGGAERRAVTFGDLWLGGTTDRTPEGADLLRRAAIDPELRTIELALTATNLAEHRPYRLPFRSANATSEGELTRVGTCGVENVGAPEVRVTSESLGKTR